MDNLAQLFGQPGQPGEILVTCLGGLAKGVRIDVEVPHGGEGGIGGKRGEGIGDIDEKQIPLVRGGAGGGYEYLPILEAFNFYLVNCAQEDKPLVFKEPGHHEAEWPYDSPTATMVFIGAGGGGGGAAGFIRDGEPGEQGLSGQIWIFPTYVERHRISQATS